MMNLYNAALLPLRGVAEVWARFQELTGARADEWGERLARTLPSVAPGGVWIHGSSVGEARLVGLIAGALRERRPTLGLVASAFTPTGRAALPNPPSVDACFFAPLDFRGPVARVLEALRPAALVLIETELWPNWLNESAHREVAVFVLNGRLSERRMNRYRRFAALYRPLFARVSAVGAQSAADAARFAELGVAAAAISVTGNIKYDLPSPADDPADLRTDLGLDPVRPVWVAGSTADGEDAMVVRAFERAREVRGDLLLVLAPRHPERCTEVARMLTARGHEPVRLSELAGRPVHPRGAVLLVDTLGMLSRLYRLATVAFVGGSLTPVGGHNVLEPVAVGVPVLFGPHTENVAEPAAELERAGAGRRVLDTQELGEAVRHLLEDEPARRRMILAGDAVLTANRGALGRSLDLLAPALRVAR